jgi:hypothetical protein
LETVKNVTALAAARIPRRPNTSLSPVLGVSSLAGAVVGTAVGAAVGAVVGAAVGATVAVGFGVAVAVGLGVFVAVGAGLGVFVGALVGVATATVGVGVGVGSSLSPHAATAATFITKRADKTTSIILLFILFFISLVLPPFDGLRGNCTIY